MDVHDLLIEITECGITLTCGRAEDRLNAKPTSALTPELVAEIREHKQEIIAVMRKEERLREDKRLEETDLIQSEWQVFEMARAHFGCEDRGKG
jgi:TubC N-terminal docking domain